jgi:thimet oligopeptidase
MKHKKQSYLASGLGTFLLVSLTVGQTACSSSQKEMNSGTKTDPNTSLIRSDYKPGEVTTLCNQSIEKARDRFNKLAKLSASERNFDNTTLTFENINADLGDEATPLTFMKYVSPDKAINAEGAKCEQAVGDFTVSVFGRRDLYNALKDEKPRNADESRLSEKTLEAFEANGLKLPDDQLAQVTALFSKLNELQTSFSNNLNKDDTKVELSAEELQGVTPDFLSRLKKNPETGKYIITTKVTDYEQVMENAKSGEARKKMALAYNNRQGIENTKLLEEAILVREQIAARLGYKTWADYQLSHNRMAENAPTVLKFLNGLRDKLAMRNKQDVDQLRTFKKQILPGPTSGEINNWDLPYLSYQLKKRDYALDDEKIREYFPSDYVVDGILKIYSELLGVRFENVPGAHVWAPDVKLYKIIDQKDNRLIGYFYTDFTPRQGKYEHFASFPILSGRQMPDGYSKPVAAIVGNFNPPANGKPSLLNHEEVVTIFHEFGHVMHQTLTKAPYASLSGSSVAQDFVEAPSQMLENWPWQEKILNLLSSHYLHPEQKLPPQMLKKMVKARDFQQGYFYTRQLMLALLDMDFHTAGGPVDTAAVYDKLYRELVGVHPIEGGHFSAGFSHLMGGYDAGYYGYLWSEVYAADMFTVFGKKHLLDPKIGQRYRQTILENGNMVDANVLLTQFLGRPSNHKAFLKKLHISDAN